MGSRHDPFSYQIADGPSVKVKLTGEFVLAADGKTEIVLPDVSNIKNLFKALENVYPTGKWHYCCVAVNGTMYQDDWLKSLNENDEVVIMPAIGGG